MVGENSTFEPFVDFERAARETPKFRRRRHVLHSSLRGYFHHLLHWPGGTPILARFLDEKATGSPSNICRFLAACPKLRYATVLVEPNTRALSPTIDIRSTRGGLFHLLAAVSSSPRLKPAVQNPPMQSTDGAHGDLLRNAIEEFASRLLRRVDLQTFLLWQIAGEETVHLAKSGEWLGGEAERILLHELMCRDGWPSILLPNDVLEAPGCAQDRR